MQHRAATPAPPGRRRRRQLAPAPAPAAETPLVVRRRRLNATPNQQRPSSLQTLDNGDAQAAAAIDVEYAHYELYGGDGGSKGRRLAAVSVPASVAVVARVPTTTTTGNEGWRTGLQVLYHAAYIAPPDEAAAKWEWVGGVRPPLPETETETTTKTTTTTLPSARLGVLAALRGRRVVALHGAHRDLRALFGGDGQLLRDLVIVADTSTLPPLVKPKSRSPASLQRLAREFLGREIQRQQHDPVEDAAACLDLWLDVAWPRVLTDMGDEVGLVEALGCKMARERERGFGGDGWLL
jgi:hypothetical protein